jgi:RNA polymerase sigma factor (sigma-70 family)
MANATTRVLLHHVRELVGREHAGRQSDADCLRRFTKSHDEAAFATLVRRHGPMVLGVCRRVLHNHHTTEDVFQATFLVLARKANSIRKRDAVASWLHGVAHRLALKAKADAMRRSSYERQTPTPLPDPASEASWREFCALLDEELGRLAERYRAPLVLCYLESRTRDEAARQLRLSLRTLERRLEQGRKLLRARLLRRGVTLSAALFAAALGQSATAAVPALLGVTTVRTAMQGPGGISPSVATLTLEGMKAMSAAKTKTGLALVLLAAAVSAFGVRLSAISDPPQEDSQTPRAESEQPMSASRQPKVDFYGDPLPAEAVARLGTLRLYHGQQVDRVVLSPDAKLVVSFARNYGSGNRLWDAVTGRELPLKPDLRMVPVFTAKGKLLALEGGDGIEMICRDLGGGGVVRLPVGAPEFPRDWPNVGYPAEVESPDGTMRAAIKEQRIHLYDARTDKELEPLADQPDKVSGSLAFSPDGKLLAVSDQYGVRLWDIPTRKFLRFCRAKDYVVTRIVFSADGKTLAGADGNSVTLWDVATGKWRPEFHHTYYVGTLAFLPDGKTLLSGSGYNDPIIRIWDPFTGREKGQWHGHTVDVQAIAVSPDGKIAASAGYDKAPRLWNVATGKEIRRLGEGKELIWSLEFSPDGKMLASGGKVARLWDVATGKQLRDIGGGDIQQIGFSIDGKTVATRVAHDKVIRLLDVATGQELRQFGPHIQDVSYFAFSPDGRTLATGDSAGPIHLWDLATAKEIRLISEPMKPDPRASFTLYPIAYSPDGRTLAAGYSDETVRLWEVASGQERGRFHGHRSHVSSLAFSPDGSLLASGSWDRTTMTWDITGQRTANRLPGKLEDARLNILWDDLAGTDARKAYRAIQTLLGNGRQAIPFLQTHLHPAAAVDTKRIAQFITDLDNEQFAVREQATKALREFGDVSKPALRAALEQKPSPEMSRRVKSLLAQLDAAHSPTLLRGVRGIEVLQTLGTPEARRLLQKLAAGTPEARLTSEAKAALERMKK